MATFPVYAVFDRTANTAVIELGNASSIGGKGTLGVQIAISVISRFTGIHNVDSTLYLLKCWATAESAFELREGTKKHQPCQEMTSALKMQYVRQQG